jgi:hypothetical protein
MVHDCPRADVDGAAGNRALAERRLVRHARWGARPIISPTPPPAARGLLELE